MNSVSLSSAERQTSKIKSKKTKTSTIGQYFLSAARVRPFKWLTTAGIVAGGLFIGGERAAQADAEAVVIETNLNASTCRVGRISITESGVRNRPEDTIPLKNNSNPVDIVVDGSMAYTVNQDTNDVSQVNLDNESVSYFPSGRTPVEIANVGEEIWITNVNDDTITIKNKLSGQITTLPVDHYPHGITSDGTYVYITYVNDRGQVSKIDRESKQIIDQLTIKPIKYEDTEQNCDPGLHHPINDGKYLYIPNQSNLCGGTVVKINIENGNFYEVTESPFPAGLSPASVALHNNKLTVVGGNSLPLLVLDPNTGAVLETFEGFCSGPYDHKDYNGKLYVACGGQVYPDTTIGGFLQIEGCGTPNKCAVTSWTSTGLYNRGFDIRETAPVPVDTDGDGIEDGLDNCPTTPNTDQANLDNDAQGDACDPDDDNDTIEDGADNCPRTANIDQANCEGDAQGNVCDTDDDNDGVLDVNEIPGCECDADPDCGSDPDLDDDGVLNEDDNCPTTPNTDQANLDNDAQGDACDPDDDNDMIEDGVDNCPRTANTDQANCEGDAQGDLCDSDDDNDGILDQSEIPGCECDANPECGSDPDLDDDGVSNEDDNCPTTPNPDQLNRNQNGQGDVCDLETLAIQLGWTTDCPVENQSPQSYPNGAIPINTPDHPLFQGDGTNCNIKTKRGDVINITRATISWFVSYVGDRVNLIFGTVLKPDAEHRKEDQATNPDENRTDVRIEDENQMGNTIVVEGTIYESSMANPGAPSPQTDIVMIEGNIGVGAACVPPNGHNAELEAAANVRMCEPEEVEYFSSDGQNGPSSGSVPADQQDEAPTGESGESTEESGGTSGEGTEDTTGEETGGTSGEDTQATSGEGTEETTLDDSSGGTEEETPDETAGQTPEETDDDKGPIRDAVEEHDDGGCSVTPQEAQRLAELSHGKVSVKGMNDGLVQLGLIGSVVAGIYALRRRFAKN